MWKLSQTVLLRACLHMSRYVDVDIWLSTGDGIELQLSQRPRSRHRGVIDVSALSAVEEPWLRVWSAAVSFIHPSRPDSCTKVAGCDSSRCAPISSKRIGQFKIALWRQLSRL